MKLELVGMAAVKKALDRHGERLAKAYVTGAKVAAEHIITVSRFSTPVDTGALRASGVWYTRNSGWMTQIIIGHGTKVTGFVDSQGVTKDPRTYAVVRHDPQLYPDGGWFDRAVNMNLMSTIITIQNEMEKV